MTCKSALLATAFISLLFSCKEQTQKEKDQSETFLLAGKKVFVYTTADSTDLRLSLTDTLRFEPHPQPLETETCVFVDPVHSFQTFLGIGGAITDAAAETFAKLQADKQNELINAYYNPETGIGYTLARTHINSCDFSSASYTYVQEGDKALSSFDIAHDKEQRIPLIKKARAATNNHLTLFVSPWSPPAWMKDNNNMLHGGKLLPDFRQSWADYYVKFIHAYESEGVPVWGLTVQNEPMATQTWESCIYTAEDERDFIKEYLGPTLQKNGLSDKKIIAWDHNRDLILQRASTLLGDPDAAKYIWGLGFHWYEDWTGGRQVFENVQQVKNTWENKNLLFTEGCNGPFDFDKLDSWELGERYGNSMIHDFNSGAVGWTDWNILLDEHGGPNHVGNFCFAPIHAQTSTGELIYTNSYYYIGQFSKFIKPGAKRVVSTPSRSNLIATSFLNPDGSLVVVTLNQTSARVSYLLWINGDAAHVASLPHSISTVVIK